MADARVPCPLCGGLIHPVAGRCKHCKQDLLALRAARPQAPVKLPALQGSAAQAVIAAPTPTPLPQPVLPPRPTEVAADSVPPVPSAWRSWPVIVMGVSVLAILGALFVLFVLPESEPAHAGKLPPPPAPERMPTDPLPTPSQDPWAPHAQAVPVPQKPQDDDTDSLDQQFAIPAQGTFGAHMLVRACEKFTKCGTTNQFIDMWCAQVAAVKPMLGPVPTCDEGKRCFDAIDRMSCSAKPDDVKVLMSLLPDCLQASQDC